MRSSKSKFALEGLGLNIRNARLRRGIAVADLAVRAGTSPSSVTRLERGDPGVGIGTLADVLVALGLIDQLAGLFDIRKDELGLALAEAALPKRGRSLMSARRRQKLAASDKPSDKKDVVDPDGRHSDGRNT